VSDVLNKDLTNNAVGGTTAFTTLNVFSVGTLTNPGFPVAFVRIRARPTTTAGNNFVFDNWFIGHQAAAGDDYDFDGNQVRITWGGQNGLTLVPNTADIYSDIIAFPLDVTKAVIIAYDGPAGTSRSVRNRPAGTFTGINLRFKTGVQEASLTNKSSYSTSNGRLDIINLIEAYEDDASSLAAESSSNFHIHSDERASSDHLLSDHLLSDRILSDKHLSDAHLSDAMLSDRHLSDAMLSDRHLSDAHLSDAHLSDAHLSDAMLSDRIQSDKDLSDEFLSDRNASDKRDHDAQSSDFLAGGEASSSDQLLSERVSSDKLQHEHDSSDKRDHDALSSDEAASSDHDIFEQGSSSDQFLSEQVSSDIAQHERDSSDAHAGNEGASSSDKILHDAQSSEFQSNQTNAPLVGPVQVVVTVTV
jgi:pentapeptide repeat protein